ncbi:ATP-dependent DNA helicase RecG [Litorivicinus lipolyticus]|uniref:ATP-dependent DNA helicase RecG n=1 Tax=Litorivicinus lipolyticus TaxID=418701 RepID=UPI003B5C7F8E
MSEAADLSLSQLTGVGPKVLEKLSKLHVHSILDLAFHLPLRYEDRTRVAPIASLQPSMRVLIEGRKLGIREVMGQRRSLLVTVGDATGTLTLRLFHYSRGMRTSLENADALRCFGEARVGAHSLEMVHPEIQFGEHDLITLSDTLDPIYPITDGLQQKSLRKLVAQSLSFVEAHGLLEPLIPADIEAEFQLPDLLQSLKRLHHPTPAQWARFEDAPERSRLVIEELLGHRLALLERKAIRKQKPAPRCPLDTPLKARFSAALPYTPTAAQQRVVAEIEADLDRPEPMHRLIQGDVGAGKTLVAAMAALPVLAQGHQITVMAPTEILAEQHRDAFKAWFEPLGYGVVWLSGSMKAAAKRDALAQLASGQAAIAVGTHALFQNGVEFADLGLVVVDEQHRFGVHQRLALTGKGGTQAPHQLIMTATPIPRTLAMSLYADMDMSVIDELPPGRTPIDTRIISARKRDLVAERIGHLVAQGGQVYWICTLVEQSEHLAAQAAETSHAWLTDALPGLTVDLVHGRMSAEQKQTAMEGFKQGATQVLVATTVIEVGVDVPNANLIVIENAERLGLAQLHQLRGRVGRGRRASYCLLMYEPGLSENGRERLQTLRDSNDGFVIAEKDLELRGPGDMLGTRQTGDLSFRVANLARDRDLLPVTAQLAQRLLSDDPQRAQKLIQRWVGSRLIYTQV